MRFWRWLKRIFNPPKKHWSAKPFKGKIETIVLIRGHKSIAPGAKSVSGLHEWYYWEQVEKLIHVPNKSIHFVNREGTGISGSVERAAKHKPDLIIQLHFNAFNGKAHGCEALYASPSKKIATEWCKFTAKELGRKNRGAKSVDRVGRGRTNVNHAQSAAPQAFLIEPFFGDNSKDYVTVLEMAQCLNKYLVNL